MSKYRYRDGGCSTETCLKRFNKHRDKIGKVYRIKGYTYRGKYGLRPAVLVIGVNGTIRLSGLSWGYDGQGPRSLIKLLNTFPLSYDQKDEIVNTSWSTTDNVGVAWDVTF